MELPFTFCICRGLENVYFKMRKRLESKAEITQDLYENGALTFSYNFYFL